MVWLSAFAMRKLVSAEIASDQTCADSGDLLKDICGVPLYMEFQLEFKHRKVMTSQTWVFHFYIPERTYIARCVGKLDQRWLDFSAWSVRMNPPSTVRG